jgi:hypothetical protein
MQFCGNFKNVALTIYCTTTSNEASCIIFRGQCLHGDIEVKGVVETVLAACEDGAELSQAIGNYGLYRSLYQCRTMFIESVRYCAGHVLVLGCDDEEQFPVFVRIISVLMTNSHDCFFVCHRLHAYKHCNHMQAHEVVDTAQLSVLQQSQLHSLLSPWPLQLRTLHGME